MRSPVFAIAMLALITGLTGCIAQAITCPPERCGDPLHNIRTHHALLTAIQPPRHPEGLEGPERIEDYLAQELRRYGLQPIRTDDGLECILPGKSPDQRPVVIAAVHGTATLATADGVTSDIATSDAAGVSFLLEASRHLALQTKAPPLRVVLRFLRTTTQDLRNRFEVAQRGLSTPPATTVLVGARLPGPEDGVRELGERRQPPPMGTVLTLGFRPGHVWSRKAPGQPPHEIDLLVQLVYDLKPPK